MEIIVRDVHADSAEMRSEVEPSSTYNSNSYNSSRRQTETEISERLQQNKSKIRNLCTSNKELSQTQRQRASIYCAADKISPSMAIEIVKIFPSVVSMISGDPSETEEKLKNIVLSTTKNQQRLGPTRAQNILHMLNLPHSRNAKSEPCSCPLISKRKSGKRVQTIPAPKISNKKKKM